MRPLRVVLWAADLALVALVAVDFRRTPRPRALGLRRDAPLRAGLGQPFERVVEIDPAPAAAGLRVQLHEEFPDEFEVVARTLDGRPAEPLAGSPTGGPDQGVLGARPLRLARTYRGTRRGLHALGRVRLRVRGPLGLVERQERLAGAQEIAVVPALAELRRTLELAASERWRDLGVRHLRRRGGMTEFESLREYVNGDDVRTVDWKATARRSKPIVRQFQEERGQELLLLVDCGRRMAARTPSGPWRGWTKLDHALDAALQLAAVALQKGDRVGALAYDAGVRAWVPPRRGSRQLAQLSRALFALQPREESTDLARALRELGVRHRRRAMVVIVSDAPDPLSAEEERGALAHAGRRHRLVYAALDDPALRAAAEGDLAASGSGARTGAEPEPHTGEAAGGAAAARAAALRLGDERAETLRRLAGARARVLDALPAEAAGPLLASWLDARRAGAQ